MTPTIELLRQHRSIRHFSDEPISAEQREAILLAAQSASTSSLLQCASVVRITDKDKRQRLAELAGDQSWVVEAAEFWVLCADFNRHKQISEHAELGYAEQLILGCVDTALLAQNAMVAAESLGLGGVFIGGLRNQPQAVSELLDLPKFVLPLFGLCLGWPTDKPELKPRMPLSMLVHENGYQPIETETLAAYDQHLLDYYQHRSSANRHETWSEMVERMITKESRPHMLAFLQQQGWITR
ncbi:oxygen-insensitive NADPH nitroreductase [Rosenbergiella nectarea]|uniref:oxygen-insensitive NADPH nitroreductase n=1 Tax=Rosenbergiella nectarea TaxID=988801 RepID=UPI001BD9D2CC|nr:oxygen-insensitive NADPH nitroreductase [Rosenbergiella nectarea]MBT0730703.1 oxygen-insensitive NADPH nitroreductase [Rosenbergiella nectarea subsp. apis]